MFDCPPRRKTFVAAETGMLIVVRLIVMSRQAKVDFMVMN
jgi:hypothetical protein